MLGCFAALVLVCLFWLFFYLLADVIWLYYGCLIEFGVGIRQNFGDFGSLGFGDIAWCYCLLWCWFDFGCAFIVMVACFGLCWFVVVWFLLLIVPNLCYVVVV